MALANHRVRVFPNVVELEQFIRNDAAILSVVSVSTDDNGSFVLIFTVA